MVGAEQPGRDRVAVAAVLFLEHTMRCEQSQDAVQSIGLDCTGIGQVSDQYRAIADAVGNAEVGDQMEAPRPEPAVDSFQTISCGCSAIVSPALCWLGPAAGRRRS